jgi:hypothetical protein
MKIAGGRMAVRNALVPAERIERVILMIRGEKVMLDADLASLYGVTTKRLNEQVKRNIDRFPDTFMFQLTKAEFDGLKSQIATSSWGGRRKLPYVFTEHGVVMLASVLNSAIAVAASIEVVKAFVRLRLMLASNAELARKLETLEKKYDAQFKVVFDAIRQLMTPPQKEKRRIGFRIEK